MTLLDPLNYENTGIEESDYTRRAEIDVTLMHKLVSDLNQREKRLAELSIEFTKFTDQF